MSLFSRVRAWLNADPDEPSAPDDPGEGAPHARGARAGARRSSGPAPGSTKQSAGAGEPGDVREHDAAPDAGEPREPPLSVQRLALAGLPGGPSVDEAIALLRQVRGTVLEAAAVTWALRGAGTRVVPEPIRVACADILASRGDDQGALRVLEGIASTPGLILAADLYAGSGQLARAVGAVERVLAREIDAPGARERHRRWSASLGYARHPTRRSDEATVVASAGASAAGPYRLLREVARGGAGAVYEAEDEILGRKVAFKVYHGRGKDRAPLEREARTAVSLAGPGVLRVLDADPEQGWLALEWVARGSVRDMLRTGDLTALAPISRWARRLAHALARVHAHGLVHADVKPANVLFRQPNDPVLGDFGIARPIGAPEEGGGSAGYLSPERLAGRPADPRDDVYGYGRVLEDVLVRLEGAGAAEEELAPFRALAMACLGPDEERPESGEELLRRVP